MKKKLLNEADKILDKVQQALTNVDSNKPNGEEVQSF